MTAVIEVEQLRKGFGGLTAVDGLSFAVEAGTIVGLIGPNGSGKTTTLNLINGVHRPDSGTIRVGDRMLQGKPSSAFVRTRLPSDPRPVDRRPRAILRAEEVRPRASPDG